MGFIRGKAQGKESRTSAAPLGRTILEVPEGVEGAEAMTDPCSRAPPSDLDTEA